MNILVTGGAGFIGSNFIKYWLKKNLLDNLINFDKLTYAGNLDNLKDIEKLSNYKFVKGDILNNVLLEETIKLNNINTIIHFAAESHVDKSIEAPDDFIQTNIVGTFKILELIKKYPHIRFHHISTDEVFGSLSLNNLEEKFNEESAYKPHSPYSASKASADHLVRSYIDTYKIKATISNCSNNYGAYCFPEKLIPLTITRALNDEKIPVYGTGSQIRDWIYVEDHCYGIDLILNKGEIGETYLLGGNGEKSNIWIIKEVLKHLHKSEDLIVHVGDRLGHDERYSIDYSKAKRVLGFEPLHPLSQRLKETINWYINNKSWWEDLKLKANKMAEKYLQYK